MKLSKILLIGLFILIIAAGGLLAYNRWGKNNTNDTTGTTATKLLERDQVVIGTTMVASAIYPENAYESGELNFNTNIFQPLAIFDENNKITPLVATKWDNPDNLTWRFYLSPKATFSNGTKLTAEDVKFTYDYLKDSKFPIKDGLPVVKSVTVIDPTTVEFKTATPNPVLLNRLAISCFILSKKEVEANGLKNHIGSGAYTLGSLDEKQATLVRNENYWGTKPLVKKAIYKVIPTELEQYDALIKGDIDIFSYREPNVATKVESAIKAGTIKKMGMLQPGISYIDLDTLRAKSPYVSGDKNPLQDVRVRKAMYESINMTEYIKGLNGKNIQTSQMVSQGIFGFNPAIKPLSFNLADAKKLMTEAGYANGFDITVDYINLPGTDETIVPITNQWSTINIRAKANPVDPSKFFEKIVSKDTSAFIMGYGTDSMDASEVLELVLHTPTENGQYGSNNLGYSNPAVDKLTEEAQSTVNQSLRQQKMQEAMKLAMADVAKIPLTQPDFQYAMAKNLVLKSRVDGYLKIYEMAGE